MIDLNEYFYALPGAKSCDRTGETYLNEILLNSMPNGWSRQGCAQALNCEYIT